MWHDSLYVFWLLSTHLSSDMLDRNGTYWTVGTRILNAFEKKKKNTQNKTKTPPTQCSQLFTLHTTLKSVEQYSFPTLQLRSTTHLYLWNLTSAISTAWSTTLATASKTPRTATLVDAAATMLSCALWCIVRSHRSKRAYKILLWCVYSTVISLQ